MATSIHLFSRVCSRLSVCNRILKNGTVSGKWTQWSGLPGLWCPARFQHSDSANSSTSDEAVASAAEAEKTPVVIDNDLILKLLKDMEDNKKKYGSLETNDAWQGFISSQKPVANMPDPFQKGHKRCILCEYNLEVNYKNVRLLSQFVSPHTGRIYGRAVTGLCIPMQKEVARAINQSRRAGFMPFMHKKSEYLKDPRLFDPFRPTRS